MSIRHKTQGFWLILLYVFLASLLNVETATTQSPTANVKTGEGLTVVTFKVDAGTIKVKLPDDMAAGDTISGTVVAEPKGDNETERTQRVGELKGFAIEIKPPAVSASGLPRAANVNLHDTLVFVADTANNRIQRSTDGGATWQIFAGSPGPGNSTGFTHQMPTAVGDGARGHSLVQVSLNKLTQGTTAPPGQVLVVTTIPNYDFPSRKISTRREGDSFSLPAIGQQGRPVEIFGPFDGNSSNTTINFKRVADFEKDAEGVSGGFGLIVPDAESPRKVVFESPTNISGPVDIVVKDANAESRGGYRNVGVNLSALKLNLERGERTTLTIEVVGLQGIKDSVPLTLESRGVITMEGGMFQPLFIQPSQVSSEGRYTTTREIRGVQSGGWEATATVVTQPFNIILRDPDPPQTLLFNSFTGDYVFCGAGPKLSGTGQVKRDGCVITLTDNRVDRRVQGTLDSCAPVDNGRFWAFYSAGTTVDFKLTVTDTKPVRTNLYFNPIGNPAPPIQDVRAFATCP